MNPVGNEQDVSSKCFPCRKGFGRSKHREAQKVVLNPQNGKALYSITNNSELEITAVHLSFMFQDRIGKSIGNSNVSGVSVSQPLHPGHVLKITKDQLNESFHTGELSAIGDLASKL